MKSLCISLVKDVYQLIATDCAHTHTSQGKLLYYYCYPITLFLDRDDPLLPLLSSWLRAKIQKGTSVCLKQNLSNYKNKSTFLICLFIYQKLWTGGLQAVNSPQPTCCCLAHVTLIEILNLLPRFNIWADMDKNP